MNTTPSPWLSPGVDYRGDPWPSHGDTPPWSRVQMAPGTDAAARLAADLRRQAIARAEAMNADHARAAWEGRRRDPIEPHSVALLYVQPDPRVIPHGWRLTAATRLWLADDHGWDVHQRVYQFYRDLAAASPLPGGDVRALTNRRDRAMAPDASFAGIAVSSLDTSTGRWADVVATAQVQTTDTRPARLWGNADSRRMPPAPAARAARVGDHRDIPGAIRIALTDDTVIVGERRGIPDFEHKILHSTHTLDFGPYESPYPWGLVSRDQLDADPDQYEVLRWMGALLDLCWQADAARQEHIRHEPTRRTGHGGQS